MANHDAGWKKRILFTAVAVILGVSCIEGIASFIWLSLDYRAFREGLPRATQFMEEFHTRHDPELGWVNIPGKHIAGFYGPERSITINNDGFRGREDYIGKKPADRFRVVCLGDSFTLGYGVDDRFTYPAHLERINPAVQAVNMGQGGYSVGQCYLWYQQQGHQLAPDCLVFAFVLDDLWRMAGHRMANGYAKPGFELRGRRIHVTGTPVPKKIDTGEMLVADGATTDFLVERNAIMRTLAAITGRGGPESPAQAIEQVEIAMAMISEISEKSRRQNVPMLLVLMPELIELQDAQRAITYQQLSQVFHDFAAKAGIPFLDLYSAFSQVEGEAVEQYYLKEHWQHFSETGNQLVASEINAALTKIVPSYAAASGTKSGSE